LQAQTNIGVLYSRGEGCELDMAQSNRWLRKAALRGEPNAIGYLANHLLDALASNPDAAGEEPSAEALECAKWMRTAAEQNRAESVTRLGLLYWQGYGVKQDEAKALSLYEKGVRMGADPNGVDFASRPIRLRQLLSSDKAVNFDAFTTLKARLLLERDSS
jgi:TPR repeat protein